MAKLIISLLLARKPTGLDGAHLSLQEGESGGGGGAAAGGAVQGGRLGPAPLLALLTTHMSNTVEFSETQVT